MKKIVVTTNLSEHSKKVLDHTVQLFGTEVEYTLLYGFTVDYAKLKSPGDDEEQIAEKLQVRRDEHNATLSLEKTRLKRKFKDLKMDVHSREGIGIVAIESYVRVAKPDLVVVGTHIHQTGAPAARVTVATRLIGSLEIPIFVIPYEWQLVPLQRVLYAYDTIELKTDSIDALSHIFRIHQGQLKFFNVMDGKDEPVEDSILKGVGKMVGAKKVEIKRVEGEHVVEGILFFANEYKPDLIVMTARRESYLQDFWTGSKSDEVAIKLKQPMLALPS